MPAEQTRKLIETYLAAFNAGDLDAMNGFVTDDVVHDVNQGGERRIGRDRFAAFNARMAHNYRETLTDIVVLVNGDGSRAAAEFNVSGTYLNTDEGLPPASGQTYQLPAGIFFAIRDGKIARVTTYYNLTDWLTQVTSA